MAGKTLDVDELLTTDNIGLLITDQYITWDSLMGEKKKSWEEVRQYVYQTDTTQTTNVRLPWKNTTTTPKLCQIRDNLYANYMATLFPKRKWLKWEGARTQDDVKSKQDAIVYYMSWANDRPEFENEISKLVYDYIDYGNCFVMPRWIDQRKELPDKTQVGYIGPAPLRISPMDIRFNPIAPSFNDSPKIMRSFVTLGELKKQLLGMTKEEDHEQIEDLFKYLRKIRYDASEFAGSLHEKDNFFRMDGYANFRQYLGSNYCEVLTFYGDFYDIANDELLENYKIMVVDRHKIVYQKPNPSYFGIPPIFHSGWRIRQDNLWAMGPLDNLVGLQYRIDHLENMKADIWDLTAYPVIKVKGYVEDFVWQPLEKIAVGDDGDAALVVPDVNALQANLEIDMLERKMEEMAGSPKEAMGIRTPGEKTMYEVQRLENAASRMFTNKVTQFEKQIVEPYLNAGLELARRTMNSSQHIRVFDDEFKTATFLDLTPEDLVGAGRIKPIAARHFAENAQLLQNLNNFAASALYADEDIKAHMSSLKIANMVDEVLELQDFEIVQANVRLSERADAQRLMNTNQENVSMEALTPSGLTPDDYDGQ